MRARVLIRPKAGILDPQGQTVERALPALGFEGVSNVHVGRLVELDVEDPSQLDSMCERLLTNPLIEDYEIQLPRLRPRGGSCGLVKFGVVRFPGSCDEVDALQAAPAGRRRRDPLVRRPRPARRRRGDRPRRLLLRRLPAGRRDRALRAGDGGGRALRPLRRPGARHLQRLPGAVRGGAAARRAAAEHLAALPLQAGRADGGERPHAVDPRPARPASRSRSRSSTPPAATTRPTRCSTRWRRTARSSSATRRARTPTARCATSPACPTRPATSSG